MEGCQTCPGGPRNACFWGRFLIPFFGGYFNHLLIGQDLHSMSPFSNTEPNFASFSTLLTTHLAETPPARIHHYTSADALLNIIAKGEIWCTESRFLNDSKEVMHAIDVATTIIEAKLVELTGTGAVGVISFLQEVKKQLSLGASSSCFVASFTELSDSLSQWRAYCPPSGGYAIGFLAAQIQDVVSKNGYIFAKCIYDSSKQAQLLEQIISQAIEHYSKSFRNEAMQDESMVTPPSVKLSFVINFVRYLFGIAPIMKHSSFVEEKEWRIIIMGPSLHYSATLTPEYGFRASPKGIVPFYKLSLLSNSYPTLGRSPEEYFTVVLGPSVDTVNRKYALDTMLSYYASDYVYRNPKSYVQVQVSSIPYKTW